MCVLIKVQNIETTYQDVNKHEISDGGSEDQGQEDHEEAKQVLSPHVCSPLKQNFIQSGSFLHMSRDTSHN